jgi:hypothetical protein
MKTGDPLIWVPDLWGGNAGIDRVIYKKTDLKWNDTGEALTSEESEKAYQELIEYFNRKKVSWKCNDLTNSK